MFQKTKDFNIEKGGSIRIFAPQKTASKSENRNTKKNILNFLKNITKRAFQLNKIYPKKKDIKRQIKAIL
mgnify:CR=1 FL=1